MTIELGQLWKGKHSGCVREVVEILDFTGEREYILRHTLPNGGKLRSVWTEQQLLKTCIQVKGEDENDNDKKTI